MEVHSHNMMSARFSKVDDADEQATRGWGMVIGRLDRYYPEIRCRFACGGQHVEIPAEQICERTDVPFSTAWLTAVHAHRREVGVMRFLDRLPCSHRYARLRRYKRHIAPHLYRLLHALFRLFKVISDGDIVEKKNLVRQNFIASDRKKQGRSAGNALFRRIRHGKLLQTASQRANSSLNLYWNPIRRTRSLS